jgi:hypothetical protein
VDKNYVIVAGNGATSRANIEALIEDHFYAHSLNGEEVIVVITYKEKASQGQIFATQLAKDKNKELIVYSESGKFDGMPASSVIDGSIEDAAKAFAKENTVAFILWSDEDAETLDILNAMSAEGIPCFDLTEGLMKLQPSDGKKVAKPTIPEQEQVKSKLEVVEDGEDETGEEEVYEDEEEDDEETLDEEVLENLYYGVQAVAQIFAQALVEAMGNTPEKPLKAPKE